MGRDGAVPRRCTNHEATIVGRFDRRRQRGDVGEPGRLLDALAHQVDEVGSSAERSAGPGHPDRLGQ